jgi:hypothetical protein
METNRPSPDDVQDALRTVGEARLGLAGRLRSPSWYHPAAGVVLAVLVAALGLPDELHLPLMLAGVAAVTVLTAAHRRATGVFLGAGYVRHVPGWTALLAVVVFGSFAAVVLAGHPAVTAGAAAVVFVATVLLGRAIDRALVRRLPGAELRR